MGLKQKELLSRIEITHSLEQCWWAASPPYPIFLFSFKSFLHGKGGKNNWKWWMTRQEGMNFFNPIQSSIVVREKGEAGGIPIVQLTCVNTYDYHINKLWAMNIEYQAHSLRAGRTVTSLGSPKLIINAECSGSCLPALKRITLI